MPVALIVNRRSRRNRAAAPIAVPQGMLSSSPDSHDELDAALAAFAAQGVDLLVVCGGDGTLRDVVSRLPQHWRSNLPRIALMAAGNANLVAADVGASACSRAALAALQAARFRRVERRQALRASWPDGDRAPVLGFFASGAVALRATQHAHERVLSRGISHGASVLLTLLAGLWRGARGDPDWRSEDGFCLAMDAQCARRGPRFIFLATTLRRLLFGFWPFWAEPDCHGPVRVLDIASPPKRLWRRLWFLLRGRPTDAMRADGYRSGEASVVELETSDPILVDGETFAPGPSRRVRLDAGPEIEFVSV